MCFAANNSLVGKTITCWCPAEFKGAWVKYTNDYCWTQNTYYVPYSNSIPDETDDREDKNIVFYQWTPIIFILQALLFSAPRWFWVVVRDGAGINISKTLNVEKAANVITAEERNNLVSYVHKWIEVREGRMMCGKNSKTRAKRITTAYNPQSGYYLVAMHVITCFLYFASTLAQLFILDTFLQNNFLNLGPDVIKNAFSSGRWSLDTNRFPRNTLCDVNIRQLENLIPYTVQCALPVNLFNEKMFAITWFLLVVMIVLNFYNIVSSAITFLVPSIRRDFIQKRLTLCPNNEFTYEESRREEVIRKFVDEYLKMDGVFILYVMAHNIGPIVANDIIDLLFVRYNDVLNNQNKLS